MRRRLVLMRHAKSDWSSVGQGDHERPLNARGRKSAPAMARVLALGGFVPDAVCSSDSARTTETWERMALEWASEVVPQWVPALYLAEPRTILEVATTLPAEARCGLLLGHNPGMSEAASRLAGFDIELRTADAAVFEADSADWAPQAWRLLVVLRSRDAGE